MYCLECGACPREMLIEAGLGDKTISVPSCSSGEENHSVTKLKDDGGSRMMVGVLKFCGIPTQKLSRHLLPSS